MRLTRACKVIRGVTWVGAIILIVATFWLSAVYGPTLFQLLMLFAGASTGIVLLHTQGMVEE